MVCFAFIPAITLSGCAAFPKCNRAACSGDGEINAKIEAKFAQDPEIEPNAVTVQTVDRKVYLYGEVASVLELYKVNSVAGQVPGVTQVVSLVVVTN